MYATLAGQQNALNRCTGDNGWGKSEWAVVEPGKLIRAETQVGLYSIELQPDLTLQLSFSSGSESRICPTKFQAINRVQWEADDHQRRLLAQQQRPVRMKPPKW
jgi:hypothetical protein